MNEFKNHTFAICAYKESKYLEDCIKSLVNQTMKSNIIISTSTPNEYIENLAKKYNLKLYINEGEKGIGQDWNFAVSKATTDYVTVAHQDDIYDTYYLENIYKQCIKDEEIVIAFTDYGELRNDKIVTNNKLLKIKRIMLIPLKISQKSKIMKKMALSLGNPICCPSVTVNKKKVGEKPYKTNLKCSLDWDTWAEFIKIKGRFAYIPKVMMFHRIHEESETSNLIENNIRLEEDYIMFKKFWPDFIAKILMKQYGKSVESNKIEKN